MIAGLCALTVVASQVIAPASSGGLFSDSSIVASAEGAQQYEVYPQQGSDAGIVTESGGPDDPLGIGETDTTYTAVAKDGYRFVQFLYNFNDEPSVSPNNTISFDSAEIGMVSNVRAVFEAEVLPEDSTYNVTAKIGLKYTGEAQALVETTGTGGTIGYAKVPD